jgi:hypothetical protein
LSIHSFHTNNLELLSQLCWNPFEMVYILKEKCSGGPPNVICTNIKAFDN